MLRCKRNTELVNSWATVEKIFRSGKQGITGVLKTRTSPSERFVFKVSQYIDFLVEHEFKVMSRLSFMADYCPHFCSEPEMLMCLTEAKPKKYKSPFDIVSSKPLYKPVLIEEFIKGPKLGSFIDSSKSLPVIISAVKQVMMGIAMAQELKFTHYDLHTDNIILNTCEKDRVFLYVMDKDTAYMVPSNGYCAKVIDYGFSYIDSLKGNALTTSLAHTDIGYTNDRFDWLTDPKLFLVSVCYQLENAFPKSSDVKKFSNCIHNMFETMTLDWECGWDDIDGGSVLDNLIELLESECRNTSFIFSKHASDSIGILQGLVTLPLEPMNYDDICIAYSMFIKEFSKIENVIENPAHLFYILKAIVDCAKLIKDEYVDTSTRKQAIHKFKELILEISNSVAKFCTFKTLNYERLLCSLYAFTDSMTGYYYSAMNKRYNEKKRDYRNVPIRNILEILNVLHYNFQDNYTFNKNTMITVCDRVSKSTTQLVLSPKELRLLEDSEYWMIAPTLLKFYNARRDGANNSDSQSDCEISGEDER